MRVLSNKAFLAINTLLGLVVNTLTLAGFVYGVVELKPGWGPLSRPGPVLTLLYLSMLIIWLLIGFAFLRLMDRRQHQHQFPSAKFMDFHVADGRQDIPFEHGLVIGSDVRATVGGSVRRAIA